SASVITLEPSTFSVVTGANLREFVATHPDFALNLIQKLIWRVRQATGSMKSLGLDDVYARVVRLLLESSDPQGDHRVVRERMTQRDIAERVGSSREMVSRILKELTTGGYVSIETGRITILKKPPPGWGVARARPALRPEAGAARAPVWHGADSLAREYGMRRTPNAYSLKSPSFRRLASAQKKGGPPGRR